MPCLSERRSQTSVFSPSAYLKNTCLTRGQWTAHSALLDMSARITRFRTFSILSGNEKQVLVYMKQLLYDVHLEELCRAGYKKI